ncbi:MAG: diguanylate cyclase [Spirochaetaceae bacterium]|jgi:PleD family two-component response regulator|nr:diguanylate cyclase [Spirochaetaceae bacterium]
METRYTILAAGRGNILLDELCPMLRETYTVITASSAEEFFEKASLAPDLALLETLMPGMDGFELLVELKTKPVSANIPVILIAPFPDHDDEEKGLLLGAVDYIAAPVNGAVARARIKTHIATSGRIRAAQTEGYGDPLTGIANKRSFDERITLEWKRAFREKTPVSLLFMAAGAGEEGSPDDAFFKTLAAILARNARRPSDLAASLDSGRFAVLLPNTSMNGAVKIAEEIYSQAEAALGGDKNAVINIGVVSQIPQADMSLEDFFARAEKALSQAKASGLICQE